MDIERVKVALPKTEIGLKRYLYLMNRVKSVDVSKDEEFQKKFNGFYRMRQRKPEYYKMYYVFMEENKNSEITFEKTLRFFYDKFNRIEASFSSKLLATLNPNKPIWDEFVLKNLSLKKPYTYSKDRFNKTVKLYEKIEQWYIDFLKTDESKVMIQLFNDFYPNTNITDVKKIDLILWQMRD